MARAAARRHARPARHRPEVDLHVLGVDAAVSYANGAGGEDAAARQRAPRRAEIWSFQCFSCASWDRWGSRIGVELTRRRPRLGEEDAWLGIDDQMPSLRSSSGTRRRLGSHARLARIVNHLRFGRDGPSERFRRRGAKRSAIARRPQIHGIFCSIDSMMICRSCTHRAPSNTPGSGHVPVARMCLPRNASTRSIASNGTPCTERSSPAETVLTH